MKKLLLSLGSVAAIAAPIAAVVSCGSSEEKKTGLELKEALTSTELNLSKFKDLELTDDIQPIKDAINRKVIDLDVENSFVLEDGKTVRKSTSGDQNKNIGKLIAVGKGYVFRTNEANDVNDNTNDVNIKYYKGTWTFKNRVKQTSKTGLNFSYGSVHFNLDDAKIIGDHKLVIMLSQSLDKAQIIIPVKESNTSATITQKKGEEIKHYEVNSNIDVKLNVKNDSKSNLTEMLIQKLLFKNGTGSIQNNNGNNTGTQATNSGQTGANGTGVSQNNNGNNSGQQQSITWNLSDDVKQFINNALEKRFKSSVSDAVKNAELMIAKYVKNTSHKKPTLLKKDNLAQEYVTNKDNWKIDPPQNNDLKLSIKKIVKKDNTHVTATIEVSSKFVSSAKSKTYDIDINGFNFTKVKADAEKAINDYVASSNSSKEKPTYNNGDKKISVVADATNKDKLKVAVVADATNKDNWTITNQPNDLKLSIKKIVKKDNNHVTATIEVSSKFVPSAKSKTYDIDIEGFDFTKENVANALIEKYADKWNMANWAIPKPDKDDWTVTSPTTGEFKDIKLEIKNVDKNNKTTTVTVNVSSNTVNSATPKFYKVTFDTTS